MKHAKDTRNTIIGLSTFVLFAVAFALVSHFLEEQRQQRYFDCIESGGTKLDCGFTSTFGVTRYED